MSKKDSSKYVVYRDLDYLEQNIGKTIGNGECVSLVQNQGSRTSVNVGVTGTWKKGSEKASATKDLKKGAIIVFIPGKKWKNDGSCHVAVFLKHKKDSIVVIDQNFGARHVKKHELSYKSVGVNCGKNYYPLLK